MVAAAVIDLYQKLIDKKSIIPSPKEKPDPLNSDPILKKNQRKESNISQLLFFILLKIFVRNPLKPVENPNIRASKPIDLPQAFQS